MIEKKQADRQRGLAFLMTKERGNDKDSSIGKGPFDHP